MEFGLFRKFGNVSREEEEKIKKGLNTVKEIGSDEAMSSQNREGTIRNNPSATQATEKMNKMLGIDEGITDVQLEEAKYNYMADPDNEELEKKYQEKISKREEIENRKNPEDPMSVFSRN